MAKLPRKFHKVFAGSAPAAATGLEVFGSFAGGTPDYQTDPELIQGLPAWDDGLIEAVLAGNLPAIEDMNAALYEPSYQLAYLFQEGIPEWNTDTTYFTNSIVQYNGILYQSLVDENLAITPNSDPDSWTIYFSSIPSYWAGTATGGSTSVPEANQWTGLTYGNGLFVAVSVDGTHRVMTSPDGITWTARTAAEANQWDAVTYGNGIFVAVSTDGTHRVMTSPDGVTWTARTAAEANPWQDVIYANGLFVAVATIGTHEVMTSPDGVTWTARTAAENNNWNSVTYGNGVFVATAYSGTHRVMTSPDGITWTARTAAEANQWMKVTYGNGLFVAVANSGTHRVMTSPDGITWTARTAAEANPWTGVTYGNGVFVAVADTGTHRVMTSPDGITWTPRTAVGTETWYSVTFGGVTFVAVSLSGTTMVSYDGINWAQDVFILSVSNLNPLTAGSTIKWLSGTVTNNEGPSLVVVNDVGYLLNDKVNASLSANAIAVDQWVSMGFDGTGFRVENL